VGSNEPVDLSIEQVDPPTCSFPRSQSSLLRRAGAVEAIASILSIVHGIVPPTINLEKPDPKCDLNIAANAPVHRIVRVALSNAFGFGGHNTCAVFRGYETP
jgi:3-oxoacyl-[acyl-carrier-protein] synthase II